MNTYEFLCILDLKANTNYRTYMIEMFPLLINKIKVLLVTLFLHFEYNYVA